MNASSANRQRGLILIEQGRYPDAERYFREALAEDPNDPLMLYYLAMCELNQGRALAALGTIERALSLLPEVESFHALRALSLVELKRYREAQEAAQEALRIDPDSDFAYVALGAVHLARREWAQAETSAKRALDINPENSAAANQLAHALRLQNRLEESADRAAYMLEQNPEDSDTHNTAGWTALQRGRVKEAEQHFLEALRLQPNHPAAREGLKESFKARSPIYRAYLNYCFFMQRFTAGKQWLIIIGLLVGLRVVRAVLPPAIALIVVVLYLLFVLWVHVARPVGNFQLTLDRFARHALSRPEKVEAWCVGLAVLIGLPLFLIGVFMPGSALTIVGVTALGLAFPLSYVFTNEAMLGRVVFGGTAVLVAAAGGIALFQEISGVSLGSWAGTLTGAAVFSVIAVTWICNLPALNRRS